MRGVQLAQMLPNARYASRTDSIEWDWPDVIVLVKRAAERWWKEAAACGKPIVWDVLDYWLQPRDNYKPIDWHVGRVQQVARECHASLLIGATEQMAKDIGGVYLPHHSRIGLKPTPPRPELKVVGYDGSPRYLGSWKNAIEKACAARGATFVVNPPDLSQVDILVAFRGEEWDGEVCRRWKSGVKYGNAIAAGRPILTQYSPTLNEIQPCWVEVHEHGGVEPALQVLQGREQRHFPFEHGVERVHEFTVESIAQRYAKILRSVARKAA
jgi:hypothetical protein